MLAVYLAALVVGLGALALQLVGGHDAPGGMDHDVGVHGDHDAGLDSALWVLASVRFWAFALMTFGLVGGALSLLGLAGKIVALVVALGAGLAAGAAASLVIRRLLVKDTSSVVGARDVVGLVGRVIVPPSDEGHAKVRVSVKGSVVDYVAHSDEPLAEGDSVVVEELEEDRLTVSRAPKELS